MTDYKYVKKFPFYIDGMLEKKLFLMAERLKKGDVWIVIDGDEGAGKSNMACYLMYAMHCITGRPFKEENFFFDARRMFEFAKSTKGEILNWDEAALGGLSRQWQNKNQINLMQFGMTGRIKHHFVTLCIPKFDKLGEYFVRDRSIALVHVYERRNMERGFYTYYDKSRKEKLYEMWKRKHVRLYQKYPNFRSTFAGVMKKLIDEEKYEEKKLNAISEIGLGTENNKWKLKFETWRNNIAKFAIEHDLKEKIAEYLKIHPRSFYKWHKKEEEIEGRTHLTIHQEPSISNKWDRPKSKEIIVTTH